jgi:hypothetical protein
MLIFCVGVAFFCFSFCHGAWYCYSSLCGLHMRVCVLFIDPVLMTLFDICLLGSFFFYSSAMLLC